MRNSAVFATSVGVFAAFLVALLIYIWPVYRDPLCDFARDREMNCLTMASPQVFERGALLREVAAEESNEDAVISLPTDYLLSDACIFPGMDVEFSRFRDNQMNGLAFPNSSITIERVANTNANIKTKTLGGIEFSGGPQAKSSFNIDVTSEGATFFSIDPTRFKDSLRSCKIRKSCAARVKSGNVRIVKELLVAKNLSLNVSEDRGISVPLKAALEDGTVKAEANTGTQFKQVQEFPDRGDIAFGARLFDPRELAELQLCQTDLVVLGSSTRSKSKAWIVPRKGNAEPILEEQTVVDRSASVRFSSPDRGINEGMEPAEGWSAAKAMIDPVTATVEFVHSITAIPGAKWDNRSGSIGIPEYKTVYADAFGSAESVVTINIGNRSDQYKNISMTVKDVNQASISLPWLTPRHAYFSPFNLIRSDGEKVSLNAVWLEGGGAEKFEVAEIAPGEVVTLEITYNSEWKATSYDDGGSIRKDVEATFALE